MLAIFAPETDGYREPGKPKQPEDLEHFGISGESEKREPALAVCSADMTEDAKGLNRWIAMLGVAHYPAVDSSLFGIEELAELLVTEAKLFAEIAGDAVVDFQHLPVHPPAAVFAVALAVVAASVAVAHRRDSGLLKKEKPDSLEQIVSVTLKLTLGTANLMMEVGFGDLVRANWAGLRLIQE